MTMQEFLNRMNVLTEKAYIFNISSVIAGTNQKAIVSTMFYKECHTAKVSIFDMDDKDCPISCTTLYDEYDKNEINELFNL
jgi:hypothetical protein